MTALENEIGFGWSGDVVMLGNEAWLGVMVREPAGVSALDREAGFGTSGGWSPELAAVDSVMFSLKRESRSVSSMSKPSGSNESPSWIAVVRLLAIVLGVQDVVLGVFTCC